MALQGDYFFLLMLSFVSITIKEISDIKSIFDEIIKVRASNAFISHHLPSCKVRWQPHLLSDYPILIVSYC